MAIVQKANKQLTVEDNAVDKYLSDGYDEIDNDGKVIKSATAKKAVDVSEYNRLKAELEKLKKSKNKQE